MGFHDFGNGVKGFVCTRGRRPKPCQFCGLQSSLLCDGETHPRKLGERKLCSAPMCRACATSINGKDFCRTCVKDQPEQLVLDIPRPR